MKSFFSIIAAVCAAAVFFGCRSAVDSEPEKIHRLFNWSGPMNEEQAVRYASAGVTDALVRNLKQHNLALKYGIRPYWNFFVPAGPHLQVMTPEEEKYFAYINGDDLDRNMPKKERERIIHQRRIEKSHRYGGETVTEIATIHRAKIYCFISDKNFDHSRKKLDEILNTAPEGTAGIYLDFIGYSNFKGCYCNICLEKYQRYLAGNRLTDTPENKMIFYRNELVGYYNKVIDYIKSKRPDFKVAVHIYPVFKYDELYGNRIKADFCGQTVSWYFKWNAEKIKKYTDVVLNNAQDYYSFAEGIPFIGINTDSSGSLGYKTPADVEDDIKAILAAGGRTLMVCSGISVIKDGYYDVFKKYCGK